MPLQNRVDPFGNLFRTPARGTMVGNRGGVLHNSEREIVRNYKSRRWITCVLEFKGRRRIVMTERRYTELFFLDEATAFAARHRPCAECNASTRSRAHGKRRRFGRSSFCRRNRSCELRVCSDTLPLIARRTVWKSTGDRV